MRVYCLEVCTNHTEHGTLAAEAAQVESYQEFSEKIHLGFKLLPNSLFNRT